MPNKSKTTFKKIEKEKARKQKQRDKETRRLQSKSISPGLPLRNDQEDPDIAGIVPGPQALPDQWNDIEKD